MFFFHPKKAAVCWQDLSQKIDDAIKSISDECYLQLDGCSRLQKSAMLKENFLKLAEVTNSTSLSSSLNNGTYFCLKKSNQNGRTGETGAISGVGSLTVEESRFCRFKLEHWIHVEVQWLNMSLQQKLHEFILGAETFAKLLSLYELLGEEFFVWKKPGDLSSWTPPCAEHRQV